jgi:hypothetical protein
MFKTKFRFEDETPGAAGAAAGDKGAAAGDAGGDKGAAGDKGSVTPPSKSPWPDNWAHEIVDGDETLVPRISRYTSPKELAKALIATQNKIRSGEYKAALPKDAKPEEVAEWRRDNGIPEAPEKYDIKLADTSDKEIVGDFLKTAHSKNFTPEQVKAALEWNSAYQEKLNQTQQAKDDTDKIATTDALNVEWGGNYRRNINMVNNLLEQFPKGVSELLAQGRLADGTAIFNHPEIVKGFARIAFELNPTATVVPRGGDGTKALEAELADIQKVMRTDRNKYNKDVAMQERYRELLTAQEKLKTRKT